MDSPDIDEMADGLDLSATETPHDDFDLHIILGKLSTEVPELNKIMQAAKRFNDSHRFLINQFIVEPSMDRKKMNFLFTKHLTTVRMNLHPETFLRIQITPEESRELSRTIVKTMNTEDGVGKKDFRPWRFVITTDEKTPKEYVTMTGCSRNSTIISEASSLSKAERALFLAILEEMMGEDGTCKMSWIHCMIQKEPHKITGAKCDEFMTSMTRQKYFFMFQDSDSVEIAPRTLVEMEPWLRAKLAADLKHCDLCRRIISRPVYTAECVGCKQLSHFNCFKNATVLSKQNHMECSRCSQKLTLDEVNDQIVLKRANGVDRAPSRASRSASRAAASRSDEIDEMADEQEDVKPVIAAASTTDSDEDLTMVMNKASKSRKSKSNQKAKKRVAPPSSSDSD